MLQNKLTQSPKKKLDLTIFENNNTDMSLYKDLTFSIVDHDNILIFVNNSPNNFTSS